MDTPQFKRICIIGAGPVGLATLQAILESPQYTAGLWKPTVFEQKSNVGGVLLRPSPIYDSLTTNVPHILMSFTDFLFPPSTPLFPPAATVLTYLESYTDHYNLRPHIHFNTNVVSAEYTSNEVSPGKNWYTWNISTQTVDSEQVNHFKFDWLFVCNGHYSVPRYPSSPGLSTWVASGKASHSVTYRNPSLLPLPSSAKVLVIGGGPSGQAIVTDLLSSPLIDQVVHSTSTPPTVAIVNPKFIARPRLSQFLTPDSSTVQFCDSSTESSVSYCILATGFKPSFPFHSDDYLRPSIPSCIPPLPDMSILYNTSYGLFPLARHLFPFPGTTHKPNIAFPGLPVRVAPFPIAQIQARAALTLFEELDRDPKNPKMDWARESLDILTRYEKLKIKALETAVGNLNIANETLEVPLTLEEKIVKKWYRFETMEQIDYRDSLVEFINQLSSSSSPSPSSDTSPSSHSLASTSLSASSAVPSTLPSSTSSNPVANSSTSTTNTTTSLNPTPSASNHISRFLCQPWERSFRAHRLTLRRTWQALERSGEATEWVRGVGEGEDPVKEWVELVERVIQRGLEMEGDKREVI